MKRNQASFRTVLLALPLCAGLACIAPVQDFEDPWPGDHSAAGAEPWDWGSRGKSQPTRTQLDPGAAGDQGTSPGAATVADAGGEPPLLSWDGGVVDGPAGGSVTEGDGGRRGLGKPGGRTQIIDLYQEACRERDDLSDDVAKLSAALDRAYAMLDQSEKNGLALTGELGTAQAEVERLRKENEDLAARLTTAQIRRLEAEKMLLEARIEAYRALDAERALGAAGKDGVARVAMGGGE